MKFVHISQFYPCSTITQACELYYVCELGKYLYLNYGEALSLDGVLLKTHLKRSPLWDMFRIAITNGWVIDSNVDEDSIAISIQNPLECENSSLANVQIVLDEVPFDREDYDRRNNDLMYNIMTPIKMQVSFKERKDDYWLWTLNGEDDKNFLVNNKTLNSNKSNQIWVSLLAYVAVERLKTGSPDKLLLQYNYAIVINTMALSYLMILTDKTNCLTGWCHFNFDDTVTLKNILHFSYTSWYAEGRDLGYLDRWYSPTEKLQRLDKLDVKVGDIVWLYERNKEQSINYIKSISGCFLAKVTSIDNRKIGLECILTKKTKCQGKFEFDDKTIAVKQMYQGTKPYENLTIRKMTLDFNDIGIEYYMHTELYMLVPLSETNDASRQLVTDGTRTVEVNLPQNDLVYWILKDYNYDFNEERFLKKYFNDTEPMYTRFMRGEEI